MYFIRYQPLKDQLRARSLSDRDVLPYLIADAALTSLFMSVPLFNDFNFWDGLGACLNTAITVGGIVYAYRQNGGASGFDLIQKFVVLGWVVSIRVILCVVPIIFLLYGLGTYLNIVTEKTGPYDVIMSALVTVIFYERIGRHLRDTTGPDTKASG